MGKGWGGRGTSVTAATSLVEIYKGQEQGQEVFLLAIKLPGAGHDVVVLEGQLPGEVGAVWVSQNITLSLSPGPALSGVSRPAGGQVSLSFWTSVIKTIAISSHRDILLGRGGTLAAVSSGASWEGRR